MESRSKQYDLEHSSCPEIHQVSSDNGSVLECLIDASHNCFTLDVPSKEQGTQGDDPIASKSYEEKRALFSRWNGSAAMVLLATGCLGFTPAEYTFLQTGNFFFDAVQRLNWQDTTNAHTYWGNLWLGLLVAHVLTANVWTLLAVLQVLSGVFGQSGSGLKRYHRRFGYAAVAAAVCFNIGAIVLQKAKGVDWKADMTIIGNASMICINLILGVYAARAESFQLHKQFMAWTCAWTAAPGCLRLSRLLLASGRTCSLLSVNGYVAGSAAMMLLAMVPATVATFEASESKRISLVLFLFNFCPCAGGGILDAIGVDAGTK